MRNILLAMGLFATVGLSASNGEVAYNNGCCPEPCPAPCQPVCCTPCCVPQPRQCYNGVGYVPPFYILQCDWGLFADVEFLYWYGNETNLQFGESVHFVTDQTLGGEPLNLDFVTAQPVKHHDMNCSWDPGFRVGIGYNSKCDGWDLYLNYTWYQNDHSKSASGSFSPIIPQAGETAVLVDWDTVSEFDLAYYENVKAKYNLHFNQIDLELGKKFWLSRCFNLRPYAGIRGAWVKSKFDINSSTNPHEFETFVSGCSTITSVDTKSSTHNFTNKLWGVGIIAGIQPNWVLGSFCGCGTWSIYSNFEAGLIYGDTKAKHKQNVRDLRTNKGLPEDIFGNVTVEDSDNECHMQGIIDLALGLRWEEYWCCDRYMTTIDIGWENHLWINFAKRFYNTDFWSLNGGCQPDTCSCLGIQSLSNTTQNQVAVFDSYRTSLTRVSDLNLGGFVLRFRFDF